MTPATVFLAAALGLGTPAVAPGAALGFDTPMVAPGAVSGLDTPMVAPGAVSGLDTPMVAPGAVSGLDTPMVAPRAVPGDGAHRVCRITDKRLTELSGLAATPTGYVVVNDGADEGSHRRIFYLDRGCAVVRAVSYPSRPRDTEDLALAADGTLWVGDIGDNGLNRSTIALWRLAPGASRPELNRLTYPDGPHNAEALLLTAAGTPVVVTKTVGTAEIYVPRTPVRAGRTTPLRRAGTVSLPVTGTSNPYSLAGQLLITGGAASPDGRRAVLRTYADAFEFDVSGDDLVGALTGGTPRTIPLPDEPQGESVAYSTDGTTLLTVSEGDKPDLMGHPLPDRPAPASPSPSLAPSPSPSLSPSPHRSPAPIATAAARRGGVPVGALLAGVLLALAAGTLGVVIARRSRRGHR
jgi:hypothetical protein